MNRKAQMHRHNVIKILVTGAILLIMGAICTIYPLRPTVSVVEKRNLTPFPKFSFSTLFNGEFFSGVSAWYSDTLPFRDGLISANSKIQHLLGTSGASQGFNENGGGDDIPEGPAVIPVEENTDEPSSSEEPENTTEPAETTTEEAMIDYEALGSVLIAGDAGFEYYNFVQSTADEYIAAVNRAANALAGKANVYASVIPTSIGITLNSKVRGQISSSDQEKAINYILGSMNSNVKTVNIYNTMMNHRDEYIYYRTDHHWTGLGAYYAYTAFCSAKGFTPLALDKFTKKTFDGFYGTFYADSSYDPRLSEPDYVDTYEPPCELQVFITDSNGYRAECPLIYDESNAPASLKYGAFIMGDNPLTEIENLSMESGKSCILVKESFGNAFAPLLPYHYKHVYVIDYRHYSGNIVSFAEKYGVDDVYFLNNISMTRAASLVSMLSSRI